ncbi:MAG: hypothetical protein JNL58_15015 [Planctomyces sp.]|nr:hypothetical protein [Planctomyces sp.]
MVRRSAIICSKHGSTGVRVAILNLALLFLQNASTAQDAVPSTEDPRSGPTTGLIEGQFLFDGNPPAVGLVEIPEGRFLRDGTLIRDPEYARFRELGIRDQTLLVNEDRGIRNVIVWISDKKIPAPEEWPENAEPPRPVVRFENGMFVPHVQAWWAKHSSIQVENPSVDMINVRWHATSPGSSEFNLAVLKNQPGVTGPVSATRMPSRLVSDVYNWVQPAIIFPCRHPWVAVTDEEGKFRIEHIPTGEWEFTFWHERCGLIKTSDWPTGRTTLKVSPESTPHTFRLHPDFAKQN